MAPRTNPVPFAAGKAKAVAGRRNDPSDSDESESEDDSGENSSDNSGSDDSSGSDDDGKSAQKDNVVAEALKEARDDREQADEANRRADASRRYSDPNTIWQVLQGPNVRLLKMSYLFDEAKKRGVLRRRQDLPESAFISPLTLQTIHAEASPLLADFDNVLPIVAVSACWLTKSHPDPDGEQLRTVAAALEREATKYKAIMPGGKGFTEMGIFWDWGSLHQPEESGDEKGMRRPQEQIQV